MLKTSGFPFFVTFLALLLIAVEPAQASTTIVSTFGADYFSNTSSSSYLPVEGATFVPGYSGFAAPFTPTAEYDVTSVDLLLGWAALAQANQVVDVGIYSDSSGAPGSLIGEFTPVTVTATMMGDAPQVFSAAIGGVTGADGLVAETQYWVVLLPSVNNTYVGWFRNQGGVNVLSSETPNGSTWDDSANESQLYFDVMGNQTGGGSIAPGGGLTPEPGTLVLFALGVGGIALKRRLLSQ